MQAPKLFDTSDKRGKYGLVHNIGLGGAVVVSLLRRPEFYKEGGKDGRDRLGYNHACEVRPITMADVDKVKSKTASNYILKLAKLWRTRSQLLTWSLCMHVSFVSRKFCMIWRCKYPWMKEWRNWSCIKTVDPLRGISNKQTGGYFFDNLEDYLGDAWATVPEGLQSKVRAVQKP